jgi:osmotically-inducible protein OsmY
MSSHEGDQSTGNQSTGHQPPEYQAARVSRALAEDDRTAELGIRVSVRGDAIMLSGDVTCEHRRHDIEQVLHEVAADMRVHNDIRVTEVGEPTCVEELR